MSFFKDFINVLAGGLGEFMSRYQKAEMKLYENWNHIMREDVEVQIPSDNVMYIFNVASWDVVMSGDNVIITKKIKEVDPKVNK